MMKYVSPKAEFIKLGNTDILTASVGIDLPFVEFEKGKIAESRNADFGLKDEKLDLSDKATN